MLKRFSFFLIAVIIISSLLAPPALAEAQTMDITSGDYQYTVNGDNISVTITKYKGTGTVVTVPATITNGSTTYNVTAIGEKAFQTNTTVTGVTLQDGVKSIGDYAFQGCIKLSGVSLPDTLTSIGDYAFQNCSKLSSVSLPGNLTSIGVYAFYNCSLLTSITLDDNLQSIPDDAFSFSGLQSITIPDGVKTIGNFAFADCSSLGTVTLPGALTSLGTNVFENCYSLQKVNNIPDGLDSIPQCTFNGCSALESVDLPDSIDTIGTFAFYGSGLKSIDLPDNITDIGKDAFSRCSLDSIDLPANISAIKDDTFQYCTSLKSISIPDGVKNICQMAFDGCYGLKDVNISSSSELSAMGESAFSSCTSLTSISIPGGVKDISASAFYYCISLKSVTLSEGVETIGESSFEDCYALDTLSLPETLTSVGASAFGGCGCLESVTFPGSVNEFGDSAFNNCELLRNAYFEGNAPSVFGDNVFDSCASGFAVYYIDTSNGFSNPFHGYEARVYDPDINYTATFDLNGKSGITPVSQSVHINVKIKQPADPGCTGYSVEGWYTENKCQSANKWNFDTMGLTANMTLYANWTPVHYTISYNLDGGSVTGNPASYTIDDDDITLSNPVKTGYTFDGWTETNLSEKTKDVTIPTGSHGDLYYTAHWLVNSYLASFYSDGSCADSYMADYGSRLTDPGNLNLTKENYEVEGWYTDDGTFQNKWNFQTGTMPDNALNLYANWTGVKITVTFSPGSGAKVTPSSKKVNYKGTYGDLPVPTKSGYYFYGWYTGTDGAGNIVEKDDTVNTAHDITLYAKWAKSSTVALSKPSLTVKVTDYKTLTLTWKAVKNAQSYEIYKSVGNASHFGSLPFVTITDGSLSYKDIGLDKNVKYYYKVRACRVPYITQVYGESSVQSAKPAWPPLTLKASAKTYKSIALSWNSVAGATGYKVYRSASTSGPWDDAHVIATGLTGTSYIDDGLNKGQTYYYEVGAYDDTDAANIKTSPLSSNKYAKPAWPSVNLKASAKTYKSIALSWNSVAGATGYKVYRSASKSGPWDNAHVIATGLTGTSYTDGGLNKGQTYYYEVGAYDDTDAANIKTSPLSSYKSAKPAWPSITLNASSHGYDSIALSWNAAPGAAGYYVYRCDTSNGDYTQIEDTTDTALIDTGRTPGKTYYYEIKAYDGTETSPYCSIKKAKPVPSVPGEFKLDEEFTNCINASWDAVDGASGYELYRATSSKGAYTMLIDTDDTSFLNMNLTAGKTYYYKVRAYYQPVSGSKVYGDYTVVSSLKV